MSKLMDDLTADEARLIEAFRAAKTEVEQDAAQLLADAKTQLSPLYTAAQTVLNGK